MSGTITRLEVQKKNKERVNVYLDDAYAFGVGMTLALTLKRGQWLSDDEIARLKQEDERGRAYNLGVRFLGHRPRSVAEMEHYLEKKEFAPEAIAFAVEKLCTRGYLDDEAFARFWVDNRMRFRPRGVYGLRYELHQKGIDDEVIDQALADIDEEAAARRAVHPKLAGWRKLERRQFENKVVGFLNRRGFGYDTARTIAAQAWDGEDWIEDIDS
jgi:regulatory protein